MQTIINFNNFQIVLLDDIKEEPRDTFEHEHIPSTSNKQ